jgi:hypothetical protein
LRLTKFVAEHEQHLHQAPPSALRGVHEGVEGDRRPDLIPDDVAQGMFDDVALDHRRKCSTARVPPRHDQVTMGTADRTRTRACGENGTLVYEFKPVRWSE